MLEATVISFAFLIAGSVLFLLYLRADPSRDAAAWTQDARTAWQRGAATTSLALIKQAISLPRTGRYNARQATTTADALDLLHEVCASRQAPLPEPVRALRAQLGASSTQVEPEVVASAGQAIDGLTLTDASA